METLAHHSNTTFNRLYVFLHALVFVLGFSLVFIVGWGGAATALGQLFGQYKTVIGQVGGVVVIMFGLATLDIIRLPGSTTRTPAQRSAALPVRLPVPG